MNDFSAKYPGREYRVRWVVGKRSGWDGEEDFLPREVQAFECDSGMDDAWEMVWCPEVGCSIGYEMTYDNSHDAWEAAKVKWAKNESAFNTEKEEFWKAYAKREA